MAVGHALQMGYTTSTADKLYVVCVYILHVSLLLHLSLLVSHQGEWK